jgi:hypothetical protein
MTSDDLSEYAEGTEEFVEEIRRAFVDSEYPGDDNIAMAYPHWENDEIARAFKGKHWRELSTPFLLPYRMNFYRFTAQAFQFYFPAFLIAVLTDRNATDIDFFLAQMFVPPDEGDEANMQSFKARLDAFTSEQFEVAKKYILSYVEENPWYGSGDITKEKIASFWNIDPE